MKKRIFKRNLKKLQGEWINETNSLTLNIKYISLIKIIIGDSIELHNLNFKGVLINMNQNVFHFSKNLDSSNSDVIFRIYLLDNIKKIEVIDFNGGWSGIYRYI